MYKKIFFVSCLFISSIALSQELKVKVSGKAYYDVLHVYDTTNNSPFNEVAILYFSPELSLYRSYEFMTGQASFRKWRENGSTGSMPRVGRGSRDLFYTNLKNNKVSRVQEFSDGGNISRRNFVMPEPISPTNWKILNETKRIGNYSCQKAIGFCRGRNYIVWFCNDIPFSFGPWKLSGLPGLIIEAEDIKKQVVFRFNKIEYPLSFEEYIEPLVNPIITKEIDFEKMRQAYYDASTGNGVSAVIRNAQGQEVHPKRPEINNPMDLLSKLPKIF